MPEFFYCYTCYLCIFIILGIYYCPDLKEYDQILEHIQGFPLVTKPEIFGLHENADLIRERQESELLLSSVLKTEVNYLIVNNLINVRSTIIFIFLNNLNCYKGPSCK
jgi:hypothetical protein